MHRNGFTLIELLIVVVIIGILAAIAIPKFSSTKEKAIIAGMKTDLRNFASVQEAYYADYSVYGTLPSLQTAPFNFKLSGANTATSGGGGVSWSLDVTNPAVTSTSTDHCHVSGHTGSTDEGSPTCD